jgi:hypothetical protein
VLPMPDNTFSDRLTRKFGLLLEKKTVRNLITCTRKDRHQYNPDQRSTNQRVGTIIEEPYGWKVFEHERGLPNEDDDSVTRRHL